MKTRSIVTVLIACSALSGAQALAGSESRFEGAAHDAWLTGKIETIYTLNRHLNPFSIDTDVDNGVVHLTGTVKSDIDRDLAGELAKGVTGVVDVVNDLEVDTKAVAEERGQSASKRRDFGSWVDDATTTAAVKSKLIGNSNTKGLKIDVDTRDDVVTLSGRVKTEAEKTLAEEIARNTGDVKAIHNNLVVDPS